MSEVLLIGPDGARARLTARDLAAQERSSVRATIHGESRLYEGVALHRLLALVGAPAGTPCAETLAHIVIVSGKGGYEVAFSLGETDPILRAGAVILADRVDGAALGADGPFRLIVEDDLRAARAARMVERIEVRRIAGSGISRA